MKKTGPGKVTAGDIVTTGDLAVLNPGLTICTLDEGAEIRMEFTVNTGKGYVPADHNRNEDSPIGLIPIDSLYSPVRKVSYRVENTREGPEPRTRQADDGGRDRRVDHAGGRDRLFGHAFFRIS